jgi:CHAT domain-containing protein/tetratricopeptide (TPR) repeat protein
MSLHRLAAGLLLLPALIVLAPAQEQTKDAVKQFEDLLNRTKKWGQEEFARAARDLRERADDLNKVLFLLEAGQLAGENEFRAAADKLERAIREFERKPLGRLAPTEALAYRDALLELGRVCAVMGEQDQARQRALQAEATHARLPPAARPDSFAGQLDAIRTTLTVGLILQACDRPNEAAGRIGDALARCRALPAPFNLPKQNPVLAQILLVQSAIANSVGNPDEARPAADRALDLVRKRVGPAPLPQDSLELAAALLNLAQAHVSLGEGPAAMLLLREAESVLARLAPRGDLLRAETCRTLAQLHLQRGEQAQALENVARSRKYYERLFPDEKYPRSHPGLIQAMTSLADLLNQFGRPDEALPLSAAAWERAQRFYKEPHEQKASMLLAYGRSLRGAGRLPDALRRFEEAVAMARQLYPAADHPRGHPLLALALVHLGGIRGRLGQDAGARQALEEAQTMYRALYPGGHPHDSAVASYLGVLALHRGEARAARDAFAEALESDLGQLRRWARTAAEAEALTFARPRQLGLHGYLSASRGDSGEDARAFAWVRAVKNVVTRLALARRAAVRLARQKSPELRRLQEELIKTCACLHSLLLGAREESAVSDLLEQRDRLEAQLERHWPALRFPAVPDGSAPDALAARLPRGSALIEWVRYEDFARADAVETRYVAFVVLPGGVPRRVELGPARPIDRAVNAWREAVAAWDPLATGAREQWERRSDAEAANLRRLVWEPLARHLPAGTRLLYLAPDGDLARFPFAALPGDDPRQILLEQFTIATVPNGSYLLDGLLAGGGPERTDHFLALGEVRYDPPGVTRNRPWPFLEGSVEGIEAAQHHPEARPERLLRGADATHDALCRSLPEVLCAHLSTHGFFREQELDRERRQLAAYLRDWRPDGDPPARGVGLGRRFPLSYTGLVLAGANDDPATAGHGDGLLTGEGISQLDLDGLRLVVLSACETGLGEYTAGEGVQGLQRAFHLAGCPNVIASLWRVPDRATRALMHEFYRQLWEKKLSSVEALRRAQLALYRDPEQYLGPDGPRGAPVQQPEGGPLTELPRPESERRRAHVRLWGAFVHDGVGYPRLDPEDLPGEEEPGREAGSAAGGNGEAPPWPLFAGLAGLAVLGVGAVWWSQARRPQR